MIVAPSSGCCAIAKVPAQMAAPFPILSLRILNRNRGGYSAHPRLRLSIRMAGSRECLLLRPPQLGIQVVPQPVAKEVERQYYDGNCQAREER